MPTQKDLYALAADYRQELLRGERGAVDELLRAYRASEKRILWKIKRFEKRLADARRLGQNTEQWAQQEYRYAEVLHQIAEETNALGGKATKLTRDLQAKNAQLGTRGTRAMIETQPGVSHSFIAVPHHAIAEMVGIASDGTPVAEMFHVLGPRAREKARDVLTSGLATGENPRAVGRRLAEELPGMSIDRATTIARQETLRAYRLAQQETYINNPTLVRGWRWLSGRDGRCCPICIAKDGSVHPTGEPFYSHVCCRCTTVPVLVHGDTNIGTGEEWLLAQDEEVQRQVLISSGRFNKWKEGTSLDNMVTVKQSERWGASLALVPLSQLP